MATIIMSANCCDCEGITNPCGPCEPALSCCVYPATCDKGPDSILFYGTTISGDGNTYGDTTNGVIREENVWAVYRDGRRSTIICLNISYDVSRPSAQETVVEILPSNVAANLASSYLVNLVYKFVNVDGNLEGRSYEIPMKFGGRMGDLFLQVSEGQCGWFNSIQDPIFFDAAYYLAFNDKSCLWEFFIAAPIEFGGREVWGIRNSNSPIGPYTSTNGFVENLVIS
jgi:hypothetical protein